MNLYRDLWTPYIFRPLNGNIDHRVLSKLVEDAIYDCHEYCNGSDKDKFPYQGIYKSLVDPINKVRYNRMINATRVPSITIQIMTKGAFHTITNMHHADGVPRLYMTYDPKTIVLKYSMFGKLIKKYTDIGPGRFVF